MQFRLAAEGQCDIAAARKLVVLAGHGVELEFNCRGKGKLDQRLPGFVNSSKFSPWLVIRDLDKDADCAASLVSKMLGDRIPAGLLFRIAVRSIESWLFADRGGVAKWMDISPARLPRKPEEIDDSKNAFALLARRSGRRELRERMCPLPKSGAKVGPEYEASLHEFISNVWDPANAIKDGSAPSLNRAWNALTNFAVA